MKQTNTSNKTLEGLCKSCGKESTFIYIGQMGDKTEMIQLYNCKSCGSSIAEQSIRLKCFMEQYDGQHCKNMGCDGYGKHFCHTPEYRTKK